MIRRGRWLLVVNLALLAVVACSKPRPQTPYVAEVPEGPGAAVVILLDRSASMDDEFGYGTRKADAARRALEIALDATGEFRRKNPDRPVRIGVYAFNDTIQELLAVREYQPEAVHAALLSVPDPAGNTAIGEALDTARAALYRSGAIRKYVVAITDGQNTAGPDPEDVAQEIARRSNGAVSISVVAVDMDASVFSFVKKLGGDVVPAQNPAALREAVQQIYEGKILAEAADAGAGTPAEAEAPTPQPTRSAK